jgi:pimeloyl-ACP methyl ester carboxylesterase
VRADEQNSISIDFTVLNPAETGLYSDSLEVVLLNQDSGAILGARETRMPLPALAKLFAPTEAGGEQHYSYSARAPFEHGTLTFRFVAHDGHKDRHEFTTRVVVAGGVLGDTYPSSSIRVGGQEVEIVPVGVQGVTEGVPGVLIVHGDDANARRLLTSAVTFAERGAQVLLVSQPGYGNSAGKRDWAGPATLAAIGAALDKLKTTPGVDPKKLFVYGQQRGATAALLLAAKRTDLAGVMVQSAEQDLWATYRAADESHRAMIIAQAGRDSAAWKARSPLLQTARIHAALCVVHTAEEDSTCIAAGRAFVEKLDKPGARVDAHLSTRTRRVNRQDGMRFALDFLRRVSH